MSLKENKLEQIVKPIKLTLLSNIFSQNNKLEVVLKNQKTVLEKSN
jgi:hypothetical protein